MQRELQELVDKAAITELLYRYCIALDAMALDEVVALFTEDCEVDYGDLPRLRSSTAAGLRRDLERLWRWQRSAHHLANPLITQLSDKDAQAISSIMAWHQAPDGGIATVFGQYHDVLLRTEQGWRIHRRRQVMNGHDEGFKVPIHPAERCPPPAGWESPL